MNGPFISLLLDPPWNEQGGGKIKRGADRHYDLLKTRDMPRVIHDSGHWNPEVEGASVWMWATTNKLTDALWLMQELGAKYVTHTVWVKANQVFPLGQSKQCFELCNPGLGQRFRHCHELFLYGRIGRVPVPPPDRRMPSVMLAPRGEHSSKPDLQYDWIVDHDPEGLRCEFFARGNPRPGWTAWGDGVENQ